MLTIARLFGKSPFAPLQTHMDKVASCISELPTLFKAFFDQDPVGIAKSAEKISKLEHEADLTKNDIRNHLPKSLFLPLDRSALLEILSFQDALADQAEEIAHTIGLYPFPVALIPEIREDLIALCQKNVEVFRQARQVIKELEDLLECSFGGIEAEKVKGMVEQIAFYEYETVQIKNRLLKTLYATGERIPYPVFHLGLTLIEKISNLSHLSEKLGNRIRMLLELH
jgi:predicted phosphate transport protein (TIGR00153 family)